MIQGATPVRAAVIVVAAGTGSRLGMTTPKAFVDVGGQTLLQRAVESAARATSVGHIVAVVPTDLVKRATEMLTESLGSSAPPVTWSVVEGADSRFRSVEKGLRSLEPSWQVVLVHDAARALAPPAVFDDVVNAVRETGDGVVASLPVVDTINVVDRAGIVTNPIDRSTLAIMQTPQGFPRTDFDDAYARSLLPDYTDDAAVFAAAGFRVRTVLGDSASFKITTPDDLLRAESVFQSATAFGVSGALGPDAVLCVGTGVDTHAFTDDPHVTLTLAGLLWPGERGLSGHSDGDAAAHAVCDALLSAAGLGDIGGIFGTDDPRFAGASGDVFVTHAVELLHAAGYEPVNVSVQIIGNRPRLSGRRTEAEAMLSSWVGAPVSVSATTTDGLGFTGRGEGVAAIASALIRALPAR
ncbi:MAG: 2-C-methyl-D-erythritol 2,4-cyclodiphosphate synthase [Microbacteriaceae bacterium]